MRSLIGNETIWRHYWSWTNGPKAALSTDADSEGDIRQSKRLQSFLKRTENALKRQGGGGSGGGGGIKGGGKGGNERGNKGGKRNTGKGGGKGGCSGAAPAPPADPRGGNKGKSAW